MAGDKQVTDAEVKSCSDHSTVKALSKAIASGADFVLIGRSFLYAVAALGKRGGEHAATVLTEELQDVMRQLGVASIDGLSDVPVTRASSRTL